MSVRCPGYLNAKSLQARGECREDYVEWFSHSALAAHRPLIDAVYRTMQYRGDGPVLLVCDILPDACLLIRFTMESRDLRGRSHQRCEAMLVGRPELSAFLNGDFKAEPDGEAAEFVVSNVEREGLPTCEVRRIKDVGFRVYARAPEAYWFKNEASVPAPPPKRRLTDSAGHERVNCPPGRRGSVMGKVLIAFLAVLSAFAGWNYVQCATENGKLRGDLNRSRQEAGALEARVRKLKGQNDELQARVQRYEKWMKTRSNFEVNKIQLRSRFEEIVKDFRAVEELLSRMDEPPRTVAREGGSQKTNSVHQSASPGNTGGTGKRQDSTGEKSFMDDPLNGVKRLLPFAK